LLGLLGSMSKCIAIIDVGSNSIKLLVADKAEGRLRPLLMKTLDVRISKGISHASPRLSGDGMKAGLVAIQELLSLACPFKPEVVELLATSAVRDAGNGREFAQLVLDHCSKPLRILSGEEEARLIGAGISSDPLLDGLADFYLFDLGGGSLECLLYSGNRRKIGLSLRLGCVRLTEAFVPDPCQPLEKSVREAIKQHVRETVGKSGLPISAAELPAVFAGGSMTCARLLLCPGVPLAQTPARVPVSALATLCEEICSLTIEERKLRHPALPPSRADVFPAALLSMLALAEIGGFRDYLHSLQNLRHGLAYELLAQ
jgi:exopolyphosphatase / guanosine-5'-triphosphate,3'-diphosphate pyrophosphatase